MVEPKFSLSVVISFNKLMILNHLNNILDKIERRITNEKIQNRNKICIANIVTNNTFVVNSIFNYNDMI